MRDNVDIVEGLDTWVGNYSYSEATDEELDESSIFMNYHITVYKEANEYWAVVEIFGQTTMESIKARVFGCEDWISLSFAEYTSDNITGLGYEANDVLISLKREDDEIYTFWGKIEPMLYLDTKSGEICFVQV